MIIVEAVVDSRSKRLVGFTPPGIPPCFDLYSPDFLSPILAPGRGENMSLYETRLYVTGDAAIAETVRVAGVLRTSVGVGVTGASRE